MNGVVVGRERELAEANGFLAEVGERACGLLLVGEAGIGKTTIWSAVLDEAVDRGYSVLTARPSEAEADLAFAVLTDVFDRVDSDVLAELPEAQRTGLEQALRRSTSASRVDPTAVALATLGALRVLAGSTTTILAIDDLQWVDAPSLGALTFAFRRLDAARVGFLVTARTGVDGELTSIALRDPSSIGRIEITGLGKRHLAQLVLDRTGRTLSPPQLGKLAQLSGGNPFYALELAATGDPDLRLPETLAVTLRARLEALSDTARAAGLAAALLGRVDGRVVGPGVDELRAAGIVENRATGPWFAHPLFASTLVEMHTEQEQRAVHLALAHVLEDIDERALHLGRGTDQPDETVAGELEEAARRLDERGAPETAAMLAERAAALTPEGNQTATTRRSIMAADLYSAAGERQAHVLPLLERLAKTLPAGPDHARVLVRLGWLGAQVDSLTTSDAVSYQQRALEECGDVQEVRAAAHAVLARMLGIGGDYRAGLRHAQLALAASDGIETAGIFPSPHGELGIAKFFAGEGLDEELFEQGIELESRAARVREPYQSARLKYALALLYAGDLSRARTMLFDLLSMATELDRVRSTAGCMLHLIDVEVRAGHIAQAEAHAAEFVHLDRQLRGELGSEWYPSGIVAVQLGRVEEARRILTDGIDYSRHIGSSIWLARHLWALGHLELSAGDLSAARGALVPLPRLLRETGLGEWSAHPVHPDAIETLVGLGDIDEAVELTDELEEYARRLDRPWGLATAARSKALIFSARGTTDAALEAADRALDEHERLDWPFEQARTLLVTGTILRKLGRRRDAAARLDHARAIFAALRNPLWLARVEAETRRLGGRRSAPGSLTPTEQRVADLAGQGLRNAEIAAQLYVTPKTVEATLSRVYRKLSVRSRTELARRLSDVG